MLEYWFEFFLEHNGTRFIFGKHILMKQKRVERIISKIANHIFRKNKNISICSNFFLVLYPFHIFRLFGFCAIHDGMF
jgi:hypothetical protein